MILLILSDEEGGQVLSHLLSPTLSTIPVARPHLSLRNVPWSEEERDVIRGCASALEARRAYRAAYPASDRTDDAIARQYFGCTHPAKEGGAEAETLDEPVEPEVAETIEGPDLSHLDPTLDGLQDEDPAPPRECTGEEVTLSAPPREPEPEPPTELKPEKKPKRRKDAWEEEEDAVISASASAATAVVDYRVARPAGIRTAGAVKRRWNLLQKRPRVGRTVRIDLPNSSMHGAVGTVQRIGEGGDCLVSVDGSPSSIWIAPERLTVVQQGGSK